MKTANNEIKSIIKTYNDIKVLINKKIGQFSKISSQMDKRKIRRELFFCLLTPQSKAESCWECVKNIEGVMKNDCQFEKLVPLLKKVRFNRTKAKRLIEARKNIDSVVKILKTKTDAKRKRDWLVKNIKGLGMKEATHFLRNIGLSENLAILDRHILRKMANLGIINKIPNSMSKKKYIEIERKLQEFSKKIGIPVADLDFVFWYQETGRIFK